MSPGFKVQRDPKFNVRRAKSLDIINPMIKDIGNFVGRYYQVLGCVSISGILLDLIFNDRLHLDLTFLLWFWAGYHLRRHHPTARRWTLGVSGAGLGLLALGFAYALAAGTEKMTVRLGSEIKNPSLGQVAAALAIFAVIIGTPAALLMTRRAKREFSSPPATC
ncbi:MAG TPA: hypothetical protein VFS19_00080 [Planctomycetota bacterium]|nr:hypothetical protein [Planctomycetota bacterium]